MVFLALALLVLGVLFIIGTFLKPKSEKEAENLRVFIEHKKAFRIAGAVLILISLAIVADATNKERASNRQELIRKLAEERMESVRRQIEEAHRKNPQLTEALVDLCIKHTSAVINGCVVMARKLLTATNCLFRTVVLLQALALTAKNYPLRQKIAQKMSMFLQAVKNCPMGQKIA